MSWAHQLACVVEDPTQCLLVKQVLEGAKHPSNSEEGTHYTSVSIPFVSLLSCLIGFAGFHEIANLKKSDVRVFDEHVELFIESSKTDQYRDGAWVTIAHSGSSTCPVQMLERYSKLGFSQTCFSLEALFILSQGIAQEEGRHKLH